MRKFKKLLSLLLSIVLIMTIIPVGVVKASQSKIENFSKTYKLTGNFRDDIVAVAMAQNSKTKSQLGYTENWCADFIYDCAMLAGMNNYPFYGGVNQTLIDKLKAIGGVWYNHKSGYSPQKGDIVFLNTYPNYSSSGLPGHVGIVTENGFDANGKVRTVEGNTGPEISGQLRVNTKNRALMPSSSNSSETMYVVGYVNLNPCSHSYGGTGICSKCNYQFPYNNDRNTSYSGTYKVKSGATAYIRKGPYQKCTEVTCATSGNFTVVARVLNCKGNYWYELSYNGLTCYVVSTNLEKVSHSHSYSYGYEAAHPHKQYKKCSCGYYEYTGSTQKVSSCTTCYPQATYGSTNPDDYVYPNRSLTYTSPTMKGEDVAWVQSVLYQLGYIMDVDGSYGKNSVATIKQFQADYGLTVDGHCGPATRAKLLELWNAKKHTHIYSVYADSTHPHKEYNKCSCGDIKYTGSNYATWTKSGYDSAHPHKTYRTCWCGYSEYTGDYKTLGTCDDCINDSLVERESNNSHTYDLYAINTTWDKAKEFCEAKGGHLATITTQDEWDSIKTFIDGKYTWLGGYLTKGSSWAWVTDEKFTFTDWLDGEPNNAGGNEGYLGAYVDGGWNDFPNSTENVSYFLCEYEPYTITFDANGGDSNPTTITKAYDETTYLYVDLPTREGYKFIGWSANPNDILASYWYGSSYTANADTTLYAIWKEEVFVTKYDYDKDLFYYSYKLDGVNTARTVASIILYNESYGSNTMTNVYGREATVDLTGKVISNVYGVGSATIPSGGFVLSAHSYVNNVFVSDYVKVGDYVYFDSLSETVFVFPTQAKMKAFLSCRNGHSKKTVIKNKVDATYNSAGYTGDTCCSVCNELLYRGEYTDKLANKGDISNDGEISNKDLALLMQSINGWKVNINTSAADVDGDGTVNNRDYALLMQYINGWTVELG